MCKNLIHKNTIPHNYYQMMWTLVQNNNSIYKQSTQEQIVEMSKNGKILKWVLPIAKHKETNEQEEYFGIGESIAIDQCDEYPWWVT